MASRGLIRLCTAAFAGSIIGIAYERFNNQQANNEGQINIALLNGNQLANQLRNLNLDSINKHYENLASKFGLPIAEAKVDLPNNINLNDDSLLNQDKKLNIEQESAQRNFKISRQYGLPSYDNIRMFNDFILSYDRRLRTPLWVLEHLTSEKLDGPARRNRVNFEVDTGLHPYFRAENNDYKNSGFDRGHLAASANHKSNQQNLEQTFLYTNIVPQDPVFNREGWNKLEKYVRWRANRSNNTFVVSGPLYLPVMTRDGRLFVNYQVIGKNNIAVPTHLFKVILYEDSKTGNLFIEAFVMANSPKVDSSIKLSDFQVSIQNLDSIERAAGIIFFDKINRDNLKMQPLPSIN